MFGPAVALAGDKPFYGNWSCALVAENAVNTQDWFQESYSDAGVSVGAEGKARKLKVKPAGKRVYELTYDDGARARIVMKEPWLMMRGTADHAFICLRKAP